MPTFTVAPSNSGASVYDVDNWDAASRLLAASLLGRTDYDLTFTDHMRRWFAGYPANSPDGLSITVKFEDESSITYLYVEKVL